MAIMIFDTMTYKSILNSIETISFTMREKRVYRTLFAFLSVAMSLIFIKAWFPYDLPDRPDHPSHLKKCSDDRDDHMEQGTRSVSIHLAAFVPRMRNSLLKRQLN
ncbi:unnamed protein product [Porites evermanni]|uniref:Uncharacterized protein n=1 Tax=Porites evermanni TaxID=104178 RepID=A0ABN8LBH8_9CNID|nr:unnamed protein product [Porites evermanni]